jgi:hypothetical protein
MFAIIMSTLMVACSLLSEKKGFTHFVILTQQNSHNRFVKTSQLTIIKFVRTGHIKKTTKNDTLPWHKK